MADLPDRDLAKIKTLFEELGCRINATSPERLLIRAPGSSGAIGFYKEDGRLKLSIHQEAELIFAEISTGYHP